MNDIAMLINEAAETVIALSRLLIFFATLFARQRGCKIDGSVHARLGFIHNLEVEIHSFGSPVFGVSLSLF